MLLQGQVGGDIQAQVEELKQIFAVYDDDGSGELGQNEFVQALSAAGAASVLALPCLQVSMNEDNSCLRQNTSLHRADSCHFI